MAEGNGHTTGNGHTENGHTMVTDLGAVGFRNSLAHFLMTKKNWWLVFAVVAAISTVGLVLLGKWTYEGKPPLANFVSASSGETVITKDQILDGKEVFHLRGLMSWGSFFGDGSERGPDFTADALHRTRLAMGEYYKNQGLDPDAIETRVKRELHENGWDSEAGVIRINDAQVYAIEVLNEHYTRMFTDETYPQAFGVMDAITEPEEIQGLTSFFFWGGWTAAADRPGQTYSYTHNWPYEPESGNIMTSQTVIWSFAAILGLFAAIMLVLYVYGQLKTLNQDPFVLDAATLTTEELEQGYGAVRPTQGAAYKFFAFAMILFAVQVFAGILSAEDFIGGEGPASATINFLGITLPYTVVRAWHTIAQIYWFFVAWVGYTIFFLPRLSNPPRGQRFLINTLFALLVIVGLGAVVGIYVGHRGYLSNGLSYWFGAQGWEFIDLGRFWHILMLGSFVLWIAIIFRGVRNWITRRNVWSVPAWLLYGSGIMVLFLFFSLGAGLRDNFAISDYWRWMTVHMWVEVTFEVFTTAIVGYLLVQMGLLRRAMAERVIYLAVMMFLVTALIGISHNFYWIAKPTGIIALGSVFSTLQVIPLILITLDAWRMRRENGIAQARLNNGKQKFVMSGVWNYILAINFWNIVGAGVFGSLLNLPVINYFEHATFITGNHAHAAMFGVKANVAICGMLFCCQHLFKQEAWSEKLVQRSFWALQIGIVLMMTLDLFPAGVYQMTQVLEHGFWYARSPAVVEGTTFETLTYLRSIGGVVFIVGMGMLVYFILSRARHLVPERDIAPDEQTIYEKVWASEEHEIEVVLSR